MKKEYKTEEKLKIIEKYKKSKLNKVEFCKRNEITPITLGIWIKESKGAVILPKFIEVEIEQKTEIIMKFDNFSITIDKNTDFNVLGSLLRLVKSI